MSKCKTSIPEWFAFNTGILLYTVMWYSMEVMLWGFQVEFGMFAIMLFMNFLAGLFGRVALWMYNKIRNDQTADI